MRSLREATPLFAFLASVALGCSGEAAGGGVFVGGTSGGSTGSGMSGNGSGATTGNTGSVTMGGAINVNMGGGGGGTSMPEKCVGTSSATTPVPPNLGFLIDTSGSMGKAPDGSPMGTPTKWVTTRGALTAAFETMAEGTGAGLIYYPNTSNRTGTMCFNPRVAVPVAPINMMQRQTILTSLTNAMINGATPTHDAYKFAVETMAASTVIGSKYVVLVTDGAPTYGLNCMGNGMAAVDAAPIVMEAATALATSGLKTFVIGTPGSETARSSLSQMATQGGTPRTPTCSEQGPEYCHFDLTTAPDLATALNEAFKAITGSVVSCSYTIPPPMGSNVIDPTKVNVNVKTPGAADTAVPKATMGCSPGSQGWVFSGDMKQIELCPDTCNQIKTNKEATVDVVIGCTSIAL